MSEPLKILQAPPSRSWQHALSLGIVGALLGFGAAFAFIFWNGRLIAPVADAFVAARAPILQHRAEKGAWPQDFDLVSPPEALLGYAYLPARNALNKTGVKGAWRFQAGTASLSFAPAEWDEDVRRVLVSVDARIDDGDPDTGLFRVSADRASLTLRAD